MSVNSFKKNAQKLYADVLQSNTREQLSSTFNKVYFLALSQTQMLTYELSIGFG